MRKIYYLIRWLRWFMCCAAVLLLHVRYVAEVFFILAFSARLLLSWIYCLRGCENWIRKWISVSFFSSPCCCLDFHPHVAGLTVFGALSGELEVRRPKKKSFQLQYIVVGERCVRVVRVGEKLKKHFQFQFAALSVLFISHSNSSSTKLSFEFKRRILTPTLSHMCVLLCIQNCEWVLNLKKNSKFLG